MALSSPLRLAPPMTPRRAPSPTMSPGGRRGRAYGSSEESRLRDLSPDTTLRAFTQRPMPFDTTCDEYRIFSCIETLTAAERDLGARVAKAAQRLKSWCAEIEQWGWTGSFEPPSEDCKERRRKSLELRIREHVGDADLSNTLPPLEYWGSLLSVEVESHEARLDDIEDEMLKLDVEELKEHVLDMHPSGKSRPSSAGFDATRQNYKPMDDFSFLITQTLLSALPHHAQLKERLSTWTARISTLREGPRYADDLNTAQKAMRLGWDAIDPPTDTSDTAFSQWKEAVDTISGVLGSKVADLGKRLDRMLDTLEGRDDCIPDRWIDVFEGIETDYGRWTHESRKKVIDFDVRRKYEQRSAAIQQGGTTDTTKLPSTLTIPPSLATEHSNPELATRSVTAFRSEPSAEKQPQALTPKRPAQTLTAAANAKTETREHSAEVAPETAIPGVVEHDLRSPVSDWTPSKKPWFMTDTAQEPIKAVPSEESGGLPFAGSDSTGGIQNLPQAVTELSADDVEQYRDPEIRVPLDDDESEFDEGDTVVHNEFDDDSEIADVYSISMSPARAEKIDTSKNPPVRVRHRPSNLAETPAIITNDGQSSASLDPPQTPRSRRDSKGSVSSGMSFESSPPGLMDESPSVRNTTNRSVRAPRPELNAAMSKRRPMKTIPDNAIASAPWPPTQFSKPLNSAEDLERKISDILTTIPAHIRLTSGPGADAPEVKPRGLAAKSSRAYLRAARSVSGLKSPELTLSPAKNDSDNAPSGRKSATAARTDNDIKLYHLTQPGKEQPVKLFIRRVGENGERVMVRVGGGWADLGEYLRQYAEHHGRRTASDGKFEILGLEVKNSDAMTSPNRPESVMRQRDRRVSGAPLSPTSTPSKTTGSGIIDDDAPLPGFNSTPGISEDPSVPSTTSSQRSWTGNEVGLAGPKAKKLDLSGEKLEWIEGMMKQARTVSGNVIHANHTPFQREERADSRSESRSDSRAGGKTPGFGDLGKVGGTKRIFLKGGKPTAGE
ncbi:hypothetical protein EK21DRAFT_52802 [Setomelanomma holmii]|uniref:GAR domain-containing protein n=1 Tax=Setomelanomma holmii TaxID=210430 RepID=A0A9P4HML5_9PLEO|nr:hypothetical protein EK21DRAFT_52802 [Setomelanomma holmii]